MKRYLLNLLTVALAGAGLASSSCSDEETGEKVPAPNFPEKTALGIEVGGTCSIPIEPNQDWSVSIDQNEAGEWFWIDDDGMTAYTVRGKAGKHEVVIRVSDKEENDTDRSIDVSMTMGGQTQVIATVTRGKVERTFDLYLGMHVVSAVGSHPFGDCWQVTAKAGGGTFRLKETSLSLSGLRPDGRAHIVDPRSRRTVSDSVVVAVEGRSAFVCEILSTALYAAPAGARQGIAAEFEGYRHTEIKQHTESWTEENL